MIPGKINTHLLQDLTVLAKANQKGSIVYISPDNKIHSGTIFQKLQAFIFKNKKDAYLDQLEKNTLNQSAKELVTDNLKNQIKLSLILQNQEITKAIDTDISSFSTYLVDQITNSNISSKNDVLKKFENLKNNFDHIKSRNQKISTISINSNLMINAIRDINSLNELSLSDKNKFKFLADQYNKIHDKDKPNINLNVANEINEIAENAAWVKKNKGVASERAFILGKEMARGELKGLTNNEKFNVIQKTLKNFVGTSKEFIKNKFSEQLKNLADSKKNKNIEKDLAEFRKTLSKEQNNLLDKELMKKVLMDNKDWKLNPKETYIQYAQHALSKDNPDIRLHEKYE